MPECPTCEKNLETEHGLKQHHAKVHGESIVYKECEVCGNEFKPSHSTEQRFCSTDCSSEHQSRVRSEEWQGKDHPLAKSENFRECEWCGSDFRTDGYDAGRFCSQECHYKWRREEWVGPTGSDHPNWDGGPVDYGENWREVRREILKRDGNECRICGDSSLVDVHHIVPRREFEEPEEANTPNNLVALCRSCHMKVEHGNLNCPDPQEVST